MNNARLIRSDVFPTDDIRINQIEKALAEFEKLEKLLAYEADGQRLLQIVNWWKYQKSSAWMKSSKLTPPPGWVDRFRYNGPGKEIIKSDTWDTGLCGYALPLGEPRGQPLGRKEKEKEKDKDKNNSVPPEVFESANKTVDGILAFAREGEEKEAKGETWPHREKFPEPIQELLDVYVKLTGQHPIKSKVSDWLLTGQEWLDVGINKIDLQLAYDKSKPENGSGFTVARPGSLTNTAGVFAGERRLKGSTSGMSAVDRIVAKEKGKMQ